MPELRITGEVVGLPEFHIKCLRNGVTIKKNGHFSITWHLTSKLHYDIMVKSTGLCYSYLYFYVQFFTDKFL